MIQRCKDTTNFRHDAQIAKKNIRLCVSMSKSAFGSALADHSATVPIAVGRVALRDFVGEQTEVGNGLFVVSQQKSIGDFFLHERLRIIHEKGVQIIITTIERHDNGLCCQSVKLHK